MWNGKIMRKKEKNEKEEKKMHVDREGE